MSLAQAHKSSIIELLAADLPGKYFKDRLYQRPQKKKIQIDESEEVKPIRT